MATSRASSKRKVASHADACRPDLEQLVRRPRRRAQDHPYRARAARLQGLPALPFRSRSPRDRRPGDARHALSHAPSHAHLAEAGRGPGVPGPARAAARGGRGRASTTSRSFPTSSDRPRPHGRAALHRRPRLRAHALEQASRGRPLVAHGIGLSIGSAGAFDAAHVEQVERWRRRLGFPAQRPPGASSRRARRCADERRHHPAAAARIAKPSSCCVPRSCARCSSACRVPFLLENNVYYSTFRRARWTSRPSSTRSAGKAAAASCSTCTTSIPTPAITASTPPRCSPARARARRRDPRRRRHGARRLLSRRPPDTIPDPVWSLLRVDAAALPELRRRHLRAVRLLVRQRRQRAHRRRPASPASAVDRGASRPLCRAVAEPA